MNLSTEQSINLFHCLNELNDRSLVKKIQQSLSSQRFSTDKLSPAQWSALVFMLLSSEEALEVFDLKSYSASEEVLLRLLPVIKASNKSLYVHIYYNIFINEYTSSFMKIKALDIIIIKGGHCKNNKQNILERKLNIHVSLYFSPYLCFFRLSNCNLSERSCEALSSVLRSQSSSLRELDLSNNNLMDSGAKMLFAELKSQHCTLETLRLSMCNLSERSCEALSSILGLYPTSLKELDLSNNDLKDSGVKMFSAGLKSPQCTLETLRLSGCLITEEGSNDLALALSSNPFHLRELDLSYNHPGYSAVKLLSSGVKDPHWNLDTLSVKWPFLCVHNMIYYYCYSLRHVPKEDKHLCNVF
uniref:NACHT LRR and PYD domain-containing protein n=1 Tax=Haplochromis burtoni TaxID=8153 RepID=A0A3Q2WHQ8_HAPBU